VARAVSKANQILGLVKRCFVYRDMELIKQLYTTMVRPHLEYGNVAWHPQFKKDIEQLERVQHRATRLVPGFYLLSYEERLKRMGLPSLVYRRLRGDAIEVYKYLHGIYSVDSSGLLPLALALPTAMITRGHSLKLQKRECRTAQRANEFGMRVVNVWNSLPEEVVQSSSVNIFKGRFDRFCEHAELQFSTDAEMGIKSIRKSVAVAS
jgi:hypothetical protein